VQPFTAFALQTRMKWKAAFSWNTFGTPLVHLFIYIVFHGKLRLALVSAAWYTGTPVFAEIRLLFFCGFVGGCKKSRTRRLYFMRVSRLKRLADCTNVQACLNVA